MESEVKNRLIQIARSCLGAPYKYGARPEDAPNFFDCSSFTQYDYKQIGIPIPRSSIEQAAFAGQEVLVHPRHGALIEIGDLLFFRGGKGHYDDSLFPNRQIYIGHVALYIGDGKIIHANGKTRSVAEMDLSEIKEKIVMHRRIL